MLELAEDPALDTDVEELLEETEAREDVPLSDDELVDAAEDVTRELGDGGNPLLRAPPALDETELAFAEEDVLLSDAALDAAAEETEAELAADAEELTLEETDALLSDDVETTAKAGSGTPAVEAATMAVTTPIESAYEEKMDLLIGGREKGEEDTACDS